MSTDVGNKDVPISTRIMPLLALLLLSFPLYAEDLTHFIDVYNNGNSVVYTNTTWIPVRCQISSKVDPNLPFGTLAEKRNVTIRGMQSYRWLRNPDTQIIFCERLIEEHSHDSESE